MGTQGSRYLKYRVQDNSSIAQLQGGHTQLHVKSPCVLPVVLRTKMKIFYFVNGQNQTKNNSFSLPCPNSLFSLFRGHPEIISSLVYYTDPEHYNLNQSKGICVFNIGVITFQHAKLLVANPERIVHEPAQFS